MKNILSLLLAITMSGNIVLLAQSSDNNSQDSTHVRIPDTRKHSLSVCPGGVAFGIFTMNYEYLLNQKHGIVVRGDYEMIPKTYSSANIESFGYSATINYRYHFSGEMNSFFLGAYTRYRVFDGEGVQENQAFDFVRRDLTYGIHAGRKWVWKNGLTATFALGYGLNNNARTVNNSNSEIEEAINEYENGYDFMTPFYGELSIGYTF